MTQSTEAPPAPETRRRGRGVTFWLGLGLVAAGLVLLGYVGWQFFGTNIVSERHQKEAVAQLQREWRESHPTRRVLPLNAAAITALQGTGERQIRTTSLEQITMGDLRP